MYALKFSCSAPSAFLCSRSLSVFSAVYLHVCLFHALLSVLFSFTAPISLAPSLPSAIKALSVSDCWLWVFLPASQCSYRLAGISITRYSQSWLSLQRQRHPRETETIKDKIFSVGTYICILAPSTCIWLQWFLPSLAMTNFNVGCEHPSICVILVYRWILIALLEPLSGEKNSMPGWWVRRLICSWAQSLETHKVLLFVCNVQELVGTESWTTYALWHPDNIKIIISMAHKHVVQVHT